MVVVDSIVRANNVVIALSSSDEKLEYCRENGADYPGLAPIYAAAGDAYAAAGVHDRAADAYAAALRLDLQYLPCDGAALADSYAKLAAALEAAGDAAGAAVGP